MITKSSNRVRNFAFGSLVLAAACSMAFGQSQTGSISGTVTDPNGGIVPDASIQATQAATGIRLNTKSSDAGLYVFPNVPTGIWTVTIEKTGFKKTVQEDIQVLIAQRQALDVQLQIGDVTQSVEVSTRQTLLEPETSEKGQNMTPRMYQTLPLWTGGLQNPSAFLGYMSNVNSGAELSIAGSTGRAREQLIDGTSNVIPESGGTVFNPPSAEAFSEFKLVQGTYTAEYGRTGGGVEVLTTKSGGNDLHGTWTYNMRRDIWEAAGWTQNQNTRNPAGFRPKDRLNETGGGVGGPVWIPKLYNGRNKTFFYFSNDNDLRPVSPASILNTIPSALNTQGNFSDIPQTIYDPQTTVGSGTSATRMPFAGNIIPPSRFSKISANILPYIPGGSGGLLSSNHPFREHVSHYRSRLGVEGRSGARFEEPRLLFPLAR